MEPVSIYVEESGHPGTPIAGVLVAVYNATGSTRYTSAVTDTTGLAGFLLAPGTYSLRFYKFQVGFTQPQRIVVISDPLTPGTTPNGFTVYGESFHPPVASDARLCRASGFFRDVTGAARQYLDLHFITQFNPVLLEGSLVMDERRCTKTDSDGYACVDLIRCANYTVTIEGFEDTQRSIRVPDSAWVNLPDLLFAVVASVDMNPVGPYAMSVGDTLVLTPTVTDTGGVPLIGIAPADVRWGTADPTIAVVGAVTGTTLSLRALSVGTTQLQADRLDNTIIRIPDTPITGVPLTITVT